MKNFRETKPYQDLLERYKHDFYKNFGTELAEKDAIYFEMLMQEKADKLYKSGASWLADRVSEGLEVDFVSLDSTKPKL